MRYQALSAMPPSHSHPDAVVFDFDGTLAELVLDFTAMKARVADAARHYLPDVPPPNGLPALEYAERLAARIRPASPEAATRFLARVARAIMDQEIEAAGHAALFPHTRQALDSLLAQNIKIGIITRNCRAAVIRIFPDAPRYAGIILARDDAPHVKPDPRHLLDALSALHVAPPHALMVGDHPMDLATGKAAGTLTAGVASGRVSKAELAAHAPDYLADDVGELVGML
jgi:phosphoglycolate phosphatase